MNSSPRDFLGYGKDLPSTAWPGGAGLAVSIVVNFEEGSERSPGRGDALAEPSGESEPVAPGVRNRKNESLFAYGSRAGFWRVLAILDRYDIKATVFACATALELNPVAATAISRGGHEVCSHGLRWMPMNSLDLHEQRRHIREAVSVIERTTGERPLGWFSWGPSEDTRALLVEEGGFLYDCDSFADDLPYFVSVAGRRCLVIPYDLVNNDGLYSRLPGYSGSDDFYHQLKAEFDWLYEESHSSPRMMSVGLHLRFSGRPGRAGALARFIRYAKQFPGVWFARRVDIARWWLRHHG